MPPVKTHVYDFLRRHYPHQVIGSKFGYFLSACYTSSPVFIFLVLYTQFYENTIGFLKKTQNV